MTPQERAELAEEQELLAGEIIIELHKLNDLLMQARELGMIIELRTITLETVGKTRQTMFVPENITAQVGFRKETLNVNIET